MLALSITAAEHKKAMSAWWCLALGSYILHLLSSSSPTPKLFMSPLANRRINWLSAAKWTRILSLKISKIPNFFILLNISRWTLYKTLQVIYWRPVLEDLHRILQGFWHSEVLCTYFCWYFSAFFITWRAWVISVSFSFQCSFSVLYDTFCSLKCVASSFNLSFSLWWLCSFFSHELLTWTNCFCGTSLCLLLRSEQIIA